MKQKCKLLKYVRLFCTHTTNEFQRNGTYTMIIMKVSARAEEKKGINRDIQIC